MYTARRLRTLLAAVVLCIAACWIGYRWRFAISAKLWHWRHGNSVQITGYIIPVPQDWRVVLDKHNSLVVSHIRGAATVSFDKSSPAYLTSSEKLENWESLTKESFQRTGVEPSARSLRIGGDPAVCVTGDVRFSASRSIPSLTSSNDVIIRADCAAIGSFTAMFTGKRSMLPAFYHLVDGIVKSK
jgi:hypothetical protein